MRPESAEPLEKIQDAMHILLAVDYQRLLADPSLSPFQSSMAVLASMTVDCFEKALHHPLTPMETPVNAESARETNESIETALVTLEKDAAVQGIRRVHCDDARVIDMGTAQLREMWRCEQDHGHGKCNQPLITAETADIILASQTEDAVLLDAEYGITTVAWITDEGFGGLEMYHLSDVAMEFEGRNGGCKHQMWIPR